MKVKTIVSRTGLVISTPILMPIIAVWSAAVFLVDAAKLWWLDMKWEVAGIKRMWRNP